MTQRRRFASEAGQATFSVVVVLVVVLLATLLVWRTAYLAGEINKKAGRIQQTAVPINRATDIVAQIPETNRLAESIRDSADPLDPLLNDIKNRADSIEATAASIDQRANPIEATASSILAEGRDILDSANSANAGVRQIIANLNITIPRASAAKGDTGQIAAQATAAFRGTACIDNKLRALPGNTGPDGHC